MGSKKWSDEEKFAIVIEGIKNSIPVAEICRKYGVSQTNYYKWRDKFLEGAKKELRGNKANTNEAALTTKIHELQRIIGKQTIAIEILKKNEELSI